ncbi:hypothetical protein [Arthrobacter sp. zg-Y877]|uniref:hypothetical protein n=1 Tax=Arthrobacter sp. zg-Y877 TaxID=3049074 RepID=UPI0025A3B0C4|nr:hypothetical protein [Arthrobacter sp. zg-Y877]MDM7990471.1 hypothetical protein [Arthrobacter sp. zg-Y877]
MKKLGAAMLLTAVITGAGVAAPASAASVSAAASEKVTVKTNVVSIFGMWPTRD